MMETYILGMEKGEKDQFSLNIERENLADYVSSHGAGFVENLDYVVDFLHKNPGNYIVILRHAEGLRKGQPNEYMGNASDLISKLDEKELPVVREYMKMLARYINGEVDFHSVKVSARKLIRLIPIPDTARIPPDSVFHKPVGPHGETLIDALEIV